MTPDLRGAALLALLLAGPAVRAAGPDGVEFYEAKVRPALVKHCYECHSATAKKARGELRLDSRDAMLKGGATGPAVVPGDPGKSLLIQAVRHADDSLKMPPKEKLPAAVIADLEAWVKMGAPGPAAVAPPDAVKGKDLWSLHPVRDPPVPPVKDAAWPLTPVDKFILAKLEQKGLKPAPPADKRALIRRATYDLTGLPPTPEEIDAFLADDSPDAFARVVDRLLASPAYGERWGRHWLDLVRYADTAGDNSDFPIPQIYRYRDWVLDAVNRDLPYDEFVRRQLAGDLMPADSDEDRYGKLVATGYLANARRFGSYEDDRYPWHLTIEDTIDNLGRTFLGLTINCCRCHDHKFDPLTQADYYALYGFFQSTRYPRPGIELDQVQRDFVPLAPADRVAVAERERGEKVAGFDAAIKALQGYKPPTAGLGRMASGVKAARLKALRKEKEDIERTPPPYPTAYAVVDREPGGKRKVGDACVQLKGDPERPGPVVRRRFPTVLGGQGLPPGVTGSGRLELARWITDPQNPLFARVMVNRIWQYHFGKGIVPTASNFGTLGQPPTHPELLDWLATRFVEGGWSLKAMHRLVMLSRAYQLSGRDDPVSAEIDPANDLRWRFDRRRLDAESIRDSLLAVAGSLDRSPAGPHPFPHPKTWNYTQHNPFKAVYETNHRTVYLMTQRIQRHPFLALFDGPDPNASTAGRLTSTTPLQALHLMNDPFVHAQAAKFAGRLFAERPDDAGRVERAYLLLYGRPPTAEETDAATEYLGRVREKLRTGGTPSDQVTKKAWESLARALFLTNEFVYLD